MIPSRIIPIIILILYTLQGAAQEKQKISFHLKGLENQKVYLTAIHGGKQVLVDSTEISDEKASFTFNAYLDTGLYSLIINDSLYLDMILAGESPYFSTDIRNINLYMLVQNSKENKVFYAYLRALEKLSFKIDSLTEKGNMIIAENGEDSPEMEALKKELIKNFQKEERIGYYIVGKSKGLFVSNYIKAGLLPNYLAYKKKEGTKEYASPTAFYKEHFFDNIELQDTNLLKTDAIFNVINDYLQRFADPPATEIYIECVNSVLTAFMENESMYNYALKLFLNTFETSIWENTYIYIVENYNLPGHCKTELEGVSPEQKVQIMKNLMTGKKAPDIELPDINNKQVKLHAVESELTLLFFWSTSCKHCKQSLPELLSIYKAYQDKGFEVYAVAMESEKTEWVSQVNLQELSWINVSSLKGMKGQEVIDYNVWYTPKFFLLNKEKIILSKPGDLQELQIKLIEYYR